MNDQIIEHPNRYKLILVPGTTDTYDLAPMPGRVTDPGTPLNKANLLSDETAKIFGLSSANATVDGALFKIASKPQQFNAYTTDLYLYITGRHPLLNAGPYNDYEPVNRNVSLSGNAETITIKDNNIWGVR